MFQIYVKDLPNYIDESNSNLFYMMIHSTAMWLNENYLFNVGKSKVMQVETHNQLYRAPELLFISGTKLESVSDHIYLGVILDNNLSLNMHVQNLYDKTVYKSGLIVKVQYQNQKGCRCYKTPL